MERHKFTVNEWVFNDSTCSFALNFSVASQEKEDCEFYTLTVPYSFEEPTQFSQKVHSMMILYVNNMRNFTAAKELLSTYTFVDSVRASNKYNIKQENDE